MNCVKQNALCWNNIQSRSSLDLLLSHLLSVLFSLQCIILQTEITLIISSSLIVLCMCVYVCVSISASLRVITVCWFVCDDSSIWVPKFTRQVSSVVKSLLVCLFHLLVIHNDFLDVEIIALSARSHLQENDRKQTSNYDEKSLQLKPREDTIYQKCKSKKRGGPK